MLTSSYNPFKWRITDSVSLKTVVLFELLNKFELLFNILLIQVSAADRSGILFYLNWKLTEDFQPTDEFDFYTGGLIT